MFMFRPGTICLRGGHTRLPSTVLLSGTGCTQNLTVEIRLKSRFRSLKYFEALIRQTTLIYLIKPILSKSKTKFLIS